MIAIDMKLITIDGLLIQKSTQLFSFIFFVFVFTHNAIFSPHPKASKQRGISN